MIAIARRLMFNPHWAWSAAAELGVFLKYPARYRNANPRIGQAMDFPEFGGETAPTSRGHARGGASSAGARLVKLRGAAERPACLGMLMDLSCAPRREARSAAPIWPGTGQ